MRNAGLEEAQARIKTARRNINNLTYVNDTTLMAESKEELKKLTAFGPITSWQIDGETMESVTDLTFGGTKITADGDCSDEIKRCLLLGRKAMNNLDSILKSRDITLPTKVHLAEAMVFPGVVCGCESWTIEKAECQRIDASELWCWEKTLERLLDCKEIKSVNPEGNQS